MSLILPNRPRFMTGFNSGSRHVALGMAPRDFVLANMSAEFHAGYAWGIQARRAGKCTDEHAASNAIHDAWDLHSRGAPAPKVVL